MAETALRKQLGEAILDDGLANTHYFNGRLLTAEALLADQTANRAQHSQLGRALGDGVAYGLEVRLLSDGRDGRPPVVAVAAGLALNRRGEAIALPRDIEVALARAAEPAAQDGGLFAGCPTNGSGNPLPGQGAYILAVRPASGFRDKAPRRGFGADARVAGCDRKSVVEGLQFRLIDFDVNELTALSAQTRQALVELLRSTTDADLGRLRNWLAHVCFGTEELTAFPAEALRAVADPFYGAAIGSPFHRYGAIDALRAAGKLNDCDVPLALVCWTRAGVRFVDMWAARRRLAAPGHARRFPLLASDRLAAETEAMMQQFQEQVQEMLLDLNLDPSSVQAEEQFRYLPPAGLLPIRASLRRGFNFDTFFTGMTARKPIFIEGAQLRPLLRQAVDYPPIDTAGEVVVWLYTVRENAQVSLTSAQPPPTYMVFASGHTPYRGEARYDVHHWNFGNFA